MIESATMLDQPAVRSAPRKRLRVALIGCGAIAEQMHLPVLAGHEQLELAVLVDRDAARAQKYAKGYKVGRVLTDTRELSRELVDVAVIATPPFHHAPCALEMIDRGIHVLVEKPMALNLAQAEQMVEAAERAGVVLSVGFFRRLYPSIRLMKAMLDGGRYGRPLSLAVEGGGMYNWAAATLGNMRRELAGGGVLIDFGSHMIDLMFALFDEPAEVLDYRDNALGGVEADCTARVRVRHAGQPVEGTIQLARCRNLGSFVRVECEEATLEFQVNDRFRVHVTPKVQELADPVSRAPREYALDAAWSTEATDEPWYATFGSQFDDLVGAIRGGEPPALSGASALATSRLIEACYGMHGRLNEPWVWAGVKNPAQTAIPLAEEGAATVVDNGRMPVHAGHAGGKRGRVLVTGASGFIGCRVAEILALGEGYEVRAAVHNPGSASRLARLDVEMVQADLGDPRDAARLVEGCDAVVHCAIGTAWGEPRKIYDVTVGGTKRLAEAALASRVARFVHLSTMSVYGDDSVLTGTLDESTPVRPTRGSIYSESKAAAERAVMELAAKGLPAAVFRPARVFGPFSRIFISRTLPAIAEGRFEWLGSPDVPCDMVYVDNVVAAILGALTADAKAVSCEAFNISDGHAMTWRAFYQYFCDHLGLDLSGVRVGRARAEKRPSAIAQAATLPLRFCRGVGRVISSSEFKSLGRRVLTTDPVGTLPRKALERFPALERTARRIVGADDSLPVYRPEKSGGGDLVHMGSAGAVLSIDKLRRAIGFEPRVSPEEAMELTLRWVRDARIV